jgi:hypothetical protein
MTLQKETRDMGPIQPIQSMKKGPKILDSSPILEKKLFFKEDKVAYFAAQRQIQERAQPSKMQGTGHIMSRNAKGLETILSPTHSNPKLLSLDSDGQHAQLQNSPPRSKRPKKKLELSPSCY